MSDGPYRTAERVAEPLSSNHPRPKKLYDWPGKLGELSKIQCPMCGKHDWDHNFGVATCECSAGLVGDDVIQHVSRLCHKCKFRWCHISADLARTRQAKAWLLGAGIFMAGICGTVLAYVV